ncbi:hypothetical protein J2Z69_002040 [Paenibacillus shirakamiensis]|uniref:PPM-type phosphatase domain-containing protein n=1 Tax=Paenibacillus shirakamiensis TaxID=1265935 RepID=A0ABS4JH05_9BACL|nr:hypothetical protein [Paenibacillus shirakamiensis]MBP2000997.1 hypothetical protein [Paenibacillus shirakamiensis]
MTKVYPDPSEDVWEWASQQKECQPLSLHTQSRFRCKYGYSPAQDTLESKEAGQDFLRVKIVGNTCYFALCDGVSMSFQGDFAARHVGNYLMEWLEREYCYSAEALAVFLNTIPRELHDSYAQLDIENGIPPLLKEVLVHKKTLGSESMFICGRLTLSPYDSSYSLWLGWMGDSKVSHWVEGTSEASPDPSLFRTSERWSVLKGCGEHIPHSFEIQHTFPQPGLHRLVLHSDGLRIISPDGQRSSGLEEHLELSKLADGQGLEDDACYLEIQWNS